MVGSDYPSTGEVCKTPGVYRTADPCGWRVFMVPRERFPDCPRCSRPVSWVFLGSSERPVRPGATARGAGARQTA